MQNTILFFDSNSEVSYDFADKNNLNILNMPYAINGKECHYDLGRNMDFKAFYADIRKGVIPTTSALNEYDFTAAFEPHLKAGKDVVYIGFSNNLSLTFESALKAKTTLKQMYPNQNVIAIDSKTISGGHAIIVEAVTQILKDEKITQEDFLKKVDVLIQKSRALVTVDDLHHLKRGGRISGAAAVLGSLLNIKPLIHVTEEGRIEKYSKAKGRKNAMAMLLDKACESGIDLTMPIYMIDADADDAALFEALFFKRFGDAPLFRRQFIGPVIGTHCGPGALSLCYFIK